MKALSIREMRASLGSLDQIVEREGELLVTRRGEPIARVIPIRPRQRMPSHEDFRRRLPRLSSSADMIRKDRDSR